MQVVDLTLLFYTQGLEVKQFVRDAILVHGRTGINTEKALILFFQPMYFHLYLLAEVENVKDQIWS